MTQIVQDENCVENLSKVVFVRQSKYLECITMHFAWEMCFRLNLSWITSTGDPDPIIRDE